MLLHNLRHAVRSLVHRPGFAIVAIATLALGIGANTAMFTVVHAVLLEPLPFADADRLVRIRGRSLTTRQLENLSPMDYLDLEARARTFVAVAAYNDFTSLTLTGFGDAERLTGTRVTASFFGVLRVRPAIGRDFRREDDVPGASPVVILTDGFWRRRFAADPSIVGQTIRLSNVPYEVIAVLPPGFSHPFAEEFRRPDVFVPFRIDRAENNRGGHYLQAVGRIRDDATLGAADADVITIAAELERTYPDSNTARSMTVQPALDAVVGGARPALVVLLATVALVLLIACANLANLLLARSSGRQREVAIRQAIGASRGDLIRQFLTESVVLGVAGGAAGILVAAFALRVLAIIGAGRIPRGDEIHLDGPVLAFTLALSVVTGLVFGVGPALLASRANVGAALKERGRAQRLLVAADIALALVLLVSAGLLAKSLWRLSSVDPGFDVDTIVTLQTSLPLARYPEGDEIPFYQQLEARLRALPGVAAVGAVNLLPLGGSYSCDGFEIEGRPAPRGQMPCAEERSITPAYFETMRIPLMRGRWFTAQDTESSRPVVIVSERMARTFWSDRDPIGQRIVYRNRALEIVGIVGDVKHFGLDRDAVPGMYTPHAQQPSFHTMTLVLRTPLDPTSLVPIVRRELASIDRDVPIANVKPMAQWVAESTTEPRFRTVLVVAFAVLAVVLSVVGVSGVISYAVGRRTREIGVRVALGARPHQVVGLLVKQGMVPTIAGLTVGGVAAFALTRLLRTLLFGVTATDLPVFASAIALLFTAAWLATYVPARRATTIDPAVALRGD